MGYWIIKESPTTGAQTMAGPFDTRDIAAEAMLAYPGPKYGLWYVSDHPAPEIDEPYGPADGDWSMWLAANNID